MIRALILAFKKKANVQKIANELSQKLIAGGTQVIVLLGKEYLQDVQGAEKITLSDVDETIDIAVVIGGDGSILYASSLLHQYGIGILGVNVGRIGFLAEAEVESLDKVAETINTRKWEIENRMCLLGKNLSNDQTFFAVNEFSIEKKSRGSFVNVEIKIDDQPVSAFLADGILVSTPTGSTAYAFSAGGPIAWPTVEALLVIPVSAHAPFSRPLVIDSKSTVKVSISASEHKHPGLLISDGKERDQILHNTTFVFTKHPTPLHIARCEKIPFADRLVKKFDLPIRDLRQK